ncbi:MAG TPA: hypothetical protein VE420_02850, partial [Gemmatimonadales bacterium]|nr:hypothetical protein [Gemmatimonadales bacterium]
CATEAGTVHRLWTARSPPAGGSHYPRTESRRGAYDPVRVQAGAGIEGVVHSRIIATAAAEHTAFGPAARPETRAG